MVPSICCGRRWLGALLGLLLAGLEPAWAEEQACGADTVGRVTCMAGRLCRCGFEPASQATRLPDGFRWDCGILRPSCGGPAPATIDPWQGGLPESLAIDRSRTIIQQRKGKPSRWPHH